MENFKIRLARSDEYEKVASIKVDASRVMGEDYATRPLPQSIFDNYAPLGDVLVVVDALDEPQGYAIAYPQEDDLYLRHLFVGKEKARQGLGTALLGKVIERACETGVRAVTLTTGGTVPWNAPFYSKHGFVVLKREMPAYLRANLEEDMRHFSPDSFPWILSHPEHLPRVAMERSFRD